MRRRARSRWRAGGCRIWRAKQSHAQVLGGWVLRSTGGSEWRAGAESAVTLEESLWREMTASARPARAAICNVRFTSTPTVARSGTKSRERAVFCGRPRETGPSVMRPAHRSKGGIHRQSRPRRSRPKVRAFSVRFRDRN